MGTTIKVFAYEIEETTDGVTIRQEHHMVEDSLVEISRDQLPMLIRHLRELCPPSTNAERQKRYRERQKNTGAAE